MLNVANPRNLVGLLIGAAVVFLFSGLAINAVSRSAGAVVIEVRRQFREFPGIMDGTQRPEYGKVVDICTRDAQRELITPGLLAILAPIAVGFGLGAGRAGVLPGRCDRRRHADGGLPGQLRWRLGQREEAGRGRRRTAARAPTAHAATVIGDTVGDPFKDTAGPAINPLLKVMNLVSLLIAPAVVAWSVGTDQNDRAAHHDRGRRDADRRRPRSSGASASRSRWARRRIREKPVTAPGRRRR